MRKIFIQHIIIYFHVINLFLGPKKKYGIVKTPRGKKKPKKDVVNKLMDNTIIILDDDDEVAAPIKDSKSKIQL